MRLFIGISIPDRTKIRIKAISDEIMTALPGKYVPGDSYHITLAYIGECDDDMRLCAISAMASCAAHHSPMHIDIAGPDFFGSPEKAILHLRADTAGRLQDVTQHLRQLLADGYLPFDPKPVVPHITLARKVNVGDSLGKMHFGKDSFMAMGLTLFHSCRINDELKYLPIHFEPFSTVEVDHEA